MIGSELGHHVYFLLHKELQLIRFYHLKRDKNLLD